MLQGVTDFLLSDASEAKQLREHFVFKIIPMLNPDGVIYGSYRSSLLGIDLNRRYLNPSRVLHPPVFFAKELVKGLQRDRRVALFVDFHGHSRKKNVFMYGCCGDRKSVV